MQMTPVASRIAAIRPSIHPRPVRSTGSPAAAAIVAKPVVVDEFAVNATYRNGKVFSAAKQRLLNGDYLNFSFKNARAAAFFEHVTGKKYSTIDSDGLRYSVRFRTDGVFELRYHKDGWLATGGAFNTSNHPNIGIKQEQHTVRVEDKFVYACKVRFVVLTDGSRIAEIQPPREWVMESGDQSTVTGLPVRNTVHGSRKATRRSSRDVMPAVVVPCSAVESQLPPAEADPLRPASLTTVGDDIYQFVIPAAHDQDCGKQILVQDLSRLETVPPRAATDVELRYLRVLMGRG